MGARCIFTIPTVEEAGSGTANGPARLSTRSSRRMVGEHVRILAVDDDPQGAQVRPRRPRHCGLHAGCDRGPGGDEARSGPA